MFTDVDLSDEKKVPEEASVTGKKSLFYRSIIRPFKENPLTSTSVVLIVFSSILLFTLLVGGRTPAVYLSKFDFSDGIKSVTGKGELVFTLYGHCVDSECGKQSMVNNFDKMPSSDEISNKNNNNNQKRGFNPSGIGSTVGNTAGNAVNGAGNVAGNAANGAGNIANNAGPTIANDTKNAGSTISNGAQDIGDDAKKALEAAEQLLSSLLQKLASFVPLHPTASFSGFISIPYLIALKLNIAALVLIYFDFSTIATLLLICATVLNALALLFDTLVFVWVFDLVALLPGMGSQHTGPGISLATWSLIFLFSSLIFRCGICSSCSAYKRCKKGIERLKKMRSKKITEEERQKQMMDRV